MKIVVAHNLYQQPGGEDTVFRSEVTLLRETGHEVHEYLEDNRLIGEQDHIRLSYQAIWSEPSRQKFRTLVRELRPDVVHFHNTFPLISPAAYSACHEFGIPVVQTLHNYRLLCPGGLLYRGEQPCEDCLQKRIKWPGVVHGCYRDSKPATAVVSAMLGVHHALGTWHRMIALYVALSEFSRHKFVAGGLPAQKIVVKPNFVSPDPGLADGSGEYALFIGRISPEKGVEMLLEAWQKVSRTIPLRIVGDGPRRRVLEQQRDMAGLSNVYFDGGLEKTFVIEALRGARFLVFPSQCYENFPLVIAEAFACGIPVIAPKLGAMAEMVCDGVTGLHFAPESTEDLTIKVEEAWTHPHKMAEMGRAARTEYETKYTAERNYQALMKVYAQAAGTQN